MNTRKFLQEAAHNAARIVDKITTMTDDELRDILSEDAACYLRNDTGDILDYLEIGR